MQPQPQASRLFPNGLRELLSVLFEEEQQAYSSAMESATDRWTFHTSQKAALPSQAPHTISKASARHASKSEVGQRAIDAHRQM